MTAAPLALLWPDVGTALAGIALLLLVGWLMVNDVARRIRLARRDAARRAVPMLLTGTALIAGAALLSRRPAPCAAHRPMRSLRVPHRLRRPTRPLLALTGDPYATNPLARISRAAPPRSSRPASRAPGTKAEVRTRHVVFELRRQLLPGSTDEGR